MKDRVYMVLAFLGAVLLVIIIRANYNTNNDSAVYDVGGMYQPDARTDLVSTQAIYQQLIGSRQIQCPTTALSMSKDANVSLSTIWGSYYSHPHRLSYLFITTAALSNGNMVRPMADDWRSVLNLSTAANNTGTHTLAELFTNDIFSNGDYIEIVAPFNFAFDNINSASTSKDESTGEDVQKIVIVNSSGTCRITFNNVSNWFCAGPEGTTSVGGTGSAASTPWEEHYKVHHTVIGNSSNATVSGGLAGNVIGYAGKNTTITIEVLNGTRYESCSLKEFILPTE